MLEIYNQKIISIQNKKLLIIFVIKSKNIIRRIDRNKNNKKYNFEVKLLIFNRKN